MNDDEFDDYWVQSPKTVQAPTQPALQIETIDGVEPLDAQLGVTEFKTVPDALYEPLFGQPDDTNLHTYAILDAAKVPNLPELLEVSGLEHRCLFKGDAYDELKDVAPWIVQLADENNFTRNLFTRSDAPWHVWDNEPGIYIRSAASLGDLWKHLRKFTKLQDEQGKWFYFRFWEVEFLKTAAAFDSYFTRQLFNSVFTDGVVLLARGEMVHFEVENRSDPRELTRHFSYVELEIIYTLMGQDCFLPVVKSIPQNHWILPVLARLLIQEMLSPEQLEKTVTLRHGTTAQRMVMSFVNNSRVAQTDRALALQHLLRSI